MKLTVLLKDPLGCGLEILMGLGHQVPDCGRSQVGLIHLQTLGCLCMRQRLLLASFNRIRHA